MGDYVPLSGGDGDGGRVETKETGTRAVRLASLDVFRGLSIALMIFVDYAGSIFPFVAHSPWNGLRLADFVMPFFLFIAGISLALVYKRISNRVQATYKVTLRTAELFFLGILLQGGYFHGINTLTFGVDIEKMRWMGILQRIAIGYIIAALCEIWSSKFTPRDSRHGFFQKYYILWFTIILLSCTYMALLYGIYVPDWEFETQQKTTSILLQKKNSVANMHLQVKCSVRGDLGPACNSAGMIDRYFLGIEHLYKKPAYRNLEECSSLNKGKVLENPPAWCQAPFDPEGILSSLTAAVTCLIGLHFGHVLVEVENHKGHLHHWLLFSFSLFALGFMFTFIGVPLNKSLYTTSYMLITTATAGITLCVLYLLVDVCSYRTLFFVLEWMGRHSLSIFVLVASNIAVIAIQGFYWRNLNNNIIHWIVSFVHK